MEKKHIITIGGKPGSGKSTTSKGLAKLLDYQHFSSGDLFRAIGKEMGIDVLQANLAAEQASDIDYRVDQRLRDIGANEDKKVIDSRMAWHWMPQSFKVFLDLDLETAAQRIIEGMDKSRLEVEHIPESPEVYADILKQRLDSEARRYNKLYEVNPYDTINYNLVINSAEYTPEEVISLITKSYTEWLAS